MLYSHELQEYFIAIEKDPVNTIEITQGDMINGDVRINEIQWLNIKIMVFNETEIRSVVSYHATLIKLEDY